MWHVGTKGERSVALVETLSLLAPLELAGDCWRVAADRGTATSTAGAGSTKAAPSVSGRRSCDFWRSTCSQLNPILLDYVPQKYSARWLILLMSHSAVSFCFGSVHSNSLSTPQCTL